MSNYGVWAIYRYLYGIVSRLLTAVYIGLSYGCVSYVLLKLPNEWVLGIGAVAAVCGFFLGRWFEKHIKKSGATLAGAAALAVRLYIAICAIVSAIFAIGAYCLLVGFSAWLFYQIGKEEAFAGWELFALCACAVTVSLAVPVILVKAMTKYVSTVLTSLSAAAVLAAIMAAAALKVNLDTVWTVFATMVGAIGGYRLGGIRKS